MAKLLVNVEHVASLRRARRHRYPEPSFAAAMVELGGADGISVHLRADRRHIEEADLELLRQTVGSRLNLEIAPTHDLLKVARQIKPDQVTIVPERPDEITTESGMDIIRDREMLGKGVAQLKESDIPVHIFIDPDIDQVKAAHKMDVDGVELNVGRYCEARAQIDRFHAFNSIVTAAKAASKLNLVVSAGLGLDYHNIRDLRAIGELEEFHVGYAVIARAMLVGMERAVREMVDLVN